MDPTKKISDLTPEEEAEWRRIFGPLPEYKPTVLSPRDEKNFQRWIRSTNWYKETNADISPNADFDYRGAYLAGINPDDNDGHWGSVNPRTGRPLKDPKRHPTWWKEEFVSQQGRNLGSGPEFIQEVVDMADKFKDKREALHYLRSLAMEVRP